MMWLGNEFALDEQILSRYFGIFKSESDIGFEETVHYLSGEAQAVRHTPISGVDRSVADAQSFVEQARSSPSFISCSVDRVLNLFARNSRQSTHTSNLLQPS